MKLVVALALAGCTAPDPVATIASPLEARADLVLASTHHSLLGDHQRYTRLAADGSPIVGADVALHPGNRVDDPHPAPYVLQGTRTLDEHAALARATALVIGRVVATTIERVAFPDGPDNDIARPGYRAVVETRAPAHGWEIWILGDTARIARDRYHFVDGTGLVFDPNPVMSTGDLTLVDGDNVTTPALDTARISVTLPRLDGTGVLRGMYADAHPSTEADRATDVTNTFAYTRDDPRFEEVSAYYHLDATQMFLQAAGFTDANARVQVALSDAIADDNSFYSEQDKTINYGTGGVDDAEDGDIVTHEYGHAVLDNIVPGWGTSDNASAMGEGFGDLLAGTANPHDALHVPMIDRACVGAWDATAYDTNTPPCLRRLDGIEHFPEEASGESHDDGEIWTGAIWELYAAIDRATVFKLVVESFYNLHANATFPLFVDAMIAADVAMNAGANGDTIRRVMWKRGLDRTPIVAEVPFETPIALATDVTTAGTAKFSDTVKMFTQPGATALRVHFDKLAMETDNQCLAKHCDNIYVFDAAGTLYGILGGTADDSLSPIVPGDTIVLRTVCDLSVKSDGYHVDRIEYVVPPILVDDVEYEPDAAGGSGSGGCCDAGGSGTSTGLVVILVGFGRAIGRKRRNLTVTVAN